MLLINIVTVMSNKRRNPRILGTQCVFAPTLGYLVDIRANAALLT